MFVDAENDPREGGPRRLGFLESRPPPRVPLDCNKELPAPHEGMRVIRWRIPGGHAPPERFLRACRAAALVALFLSTSASPKSLASPGTSSSPSITSTPSASSSASQILGTVPLCSSVAIRMSLGSQTGAAGTVRSVWQAKNVSNGTCMSFGYPQMDFRASRWLNVRVHRGGEYADINEAPQHILVAPGHSFYFVSYWSDVVDTNAGPCKQFDRVKIALPDNFHSVRLAQTGCVTTDSLHVGPVTTTHLTP